MSMLVCTEWFDADAVRFVDGRVSGMNGCQWRSERRDLMRKHAVPERTGSVEGMGVNGGQNGGI
mgnify:CR=1 FL=1